MKSSSEILRESMDAISSLVEISSTAIGGLKGTTRANRETLAKNERDKQSDAAKNIVDKRKQRTVDSGYEGLSDSIFVGGPGFALTPALLDQYIEGDDVENIIRDVLSRSRFKSPFLKSKDPRRDVFIDVVSKNETMKNLVREYLDFILEENGPSDSSSEKSIQNYQQKIKRFLLSAEKQYENRVLQTIQRK